jgi:hypothetical protein
MRARLSLLLGLSCAGLVPAQRLLLVSEFQRVMPNGAVYEPDRVEKPREIISPAVARNAYASFRVVVEAPRGASYTMYVGQNPDDSVEVRMYREIYAKVGEQLVPDALEAVKLPVVATVPEGQAVQTYWLDVFVPAKIPASRLRVEVQLNVNDIWYIAPMEVRVRAPKLPGPIRAVGALPPLSARADAAALLPLKLYACGGPAPQVDETPPTARQMIRRNAMQDMALGQEREVEETKPAVAAMMVQATGFPTVAAFCSAETLPPRGAEWWLRLRDYVVQGLPVR